MIDSVGQENKRNGVKKGKKLRLRNINLSEST
jgi:hypothetical protein